MAFVVVGFFVAGARLADSKTDNDDLNSGGRSMADPEEDQELLGRVTSLRTRTAGIKE